MQLGLSLFEQAAAICDPIKSRLITVGAYLHNLMSNSLKVALQNSYHILDGGNISVL